MKRKHQAIGGWGATTELTPRQQAEIATCRTCPLPECYGRRDIACPLHSDHKQYVELLEELAMAVREMAHGA